MESQKFKNVTMILGDCMEYMRTLPDKAYDIAIVDPPYGGSKHHQRNKQIKGVKGYGYGTKEKCDAWDIVPRPEYFNELFRVSKYQIIWGGNYFVLPPQRNFIIYYKSNIPEGFKMAVCEYAWTNIKGNSRLFNYFAGVPNPERFHPTQKPIALYKWILQNYTKKGDKILDTHAGSFSSAIAALELGYEYTGIEIDKDYFDAALERVKRCVALESMKLVTESII